MNHDDSSRIAPKLVVIIVDRKNTASLEHLLQEKQVRLNYMCNAVGTARSSLLASLGLSGSDKTICLCMEPRSTALPLLASLRDRLELSRSGNGIAFTLPLSGVSMAVSSAFDKMREQRIERQGTRMEANYEELSPMDEIKYALVLSVVNQGFSEELMEAAHSVGVPGGTIIHARRSDVEDAVKFFGVTLQAEKEIVAIVVPHSGKKALMQAITKACGINTPAHGLVVSLPVEDCAGISEILRSE